MLAILFRASAVLLGFLLIAAHAQTTAAPPRGPGVIAGLVLDANSNAPVRRAIVTLSTVETPPQDAVAWTDQNGRFSFGYLSPGGYQLRVTKDGYMAAAYGAQAPRRPQATIQLAAGESRSDFVFQLQLLSSISGIVLDEDGEPLAGAQIMAMTPGFERQKRKLLRGPGTMTDATGHYKLAGIASGTYAVAVTYVNGPNRRTRSEVSAGQPPERPYAYGVQYYSGAAKAESATLVTVTAGRKSRRSTSVSTGCPPRPSMGKSFFLPERLFRVKYACR